MAKLLMLVSSARTIGLADGSDHPTGYRAEEVRNPYRTFVAAGVDVVIAAWSPRGRKAVESGAHRAWRHNRDFIEVLAEDDEVTGRLPAMRIRQIRDEVWQESSARANRPAEALARLPGLQHPGNLAALADEEEARPRPGDRHALLRRGGAEEPWRDLRRWPRPRWQTRRAGPS